MRKLAVLLVMACIADVTHSQGADIPRPAASPILVELFTSEGCSSCPPLDTWLQQADESQAVPGAQLIVLSEHVDYWDHDGWKDPYSSSLVTDRQNSYVRALRLSTAYTPQIIVDGSTELKGKDTQQISQLFLNEAAAPKIPVSIDSASVEDKAPAMLRAHIHADGSAEKHNADIYLAVALNHAESQVLHGENGGRRLTHVAVVQELTKIGKLEKGKSFDRDFQMKLKDGTNRGNIRIVAFVQEPGTGKVLGAALQKDIKE